jgi:hypothetical protein
MKRFFSGEVISGSKLIPSVSPGFQKAKMGERTGFPLPQIPFLGICGWQEHNRQVKVIKI